jgi:FKBP-type peptidyl-prolyl cis-trans isomerase
MKEGGKRRLFIPAELAYGESSPSPLIPANSDLVFDVTLIKVGE